MTLGLLFALTIGILLAYANGSNDISKGIATLVGSGVSDYRRAVIWGTAWTAMGAVLGSLLGKAMLDTFGKGLIDPLITPSYSVALATLLGAASWVLLATRSGLPVSTTHALIGSLVGVAWLAYGNGSIHWPTLLHKIMLPLLLSPLVALILTALLLHFLKGKRGEPALPDCACISVADGSAVATSNTVAMSVVPSKPAIAINMGDAAVCAKEQPQAIALTLDHLHWLTSGLTCMARGMNDAPKIVALLAAAALLRGNGLSLDQSSLSLTWLFVVVGSGMIAGSLLSGFKVTDSLANKVTSLDHREGFAANCVTATLVTAGAVYGLPMSTTHVSSGAIISAGLLDNSLNTRMLKDMALAWVVTLPIAALLGMVVFLVIDGIMT